MTRKDMFVWIGLLVVTTIGLTIWIVLARPSAADVSQATQTLPPLSLGQLSDQTFSGLANRQNNGTVPVSPAPTDSARSDPFH